MAQKIIPPRVLQVEQTAIGQKLAKDPVARKYRDDLVIRFREAFSKERELLRRSQVRSPQDRHDGILY